MNENSDDQLTYFYILFLCVNFFLKYNKNEYVEEGSKSQIRAEWKHSQKAGKEHVTFQQTWPGLSLDTQQQLTTPKFEQ